MFPRLVNDSGIKGNNGHDEIAGAIGLSQTGANGVLVAVINTLCFRCRFLGGLNAPPIPLNGLDDCIVCGAFLSGNTGVS